MRRGPLAAALLSLAACADDPGAVRGGVSDGLVFVRVVDGTLDLARARLSDGAIRPLTRTPDRDETWPYWSEHTRRLVFQGVDSSGGPAASDLWLWEADADVERPITQTPRRDERWPAWSPRGEQLAYAFRGGEPAAGIALLDPDAAHPAPRLLASANGPDFFLRPSFSPDGLRIVAQRRRSDGAGSALWILSADAAPRPLTVDPAWVDFKARFTRDGTRVLYTREPATGGPRAVASVDLAGNDLSLLAGSRGADHHSAQPSPTRDEFAFVSDRSGSTDVYRVDFGSDAPHNLTDTADRNEYAPRWSPDGELLVVTTVDADGEQLRLAHRAELASARLRVIDRQGRVLLDTPGVMADWMPPW